MLIIAFYHNIFISKLGTLREQFQKQLQFSYQVYITISGIKKWVKDSDNSCFQHTVINSFIVLGLYLQKVYKLPIATAITSLIFYF